MANKNTKRALLVSVLACLLCVSMFVGSTFAWFTDSVSSTGNKIVSGSLKVDLELLEEDGSWTSLKETKKAIFDYQNWEPGYTDVKILKVENEGTLALKWAASFTSEKELSELADVIDVYVLPSSAPIAYSADRDLTGYAYAGSVADFVNNISETTYGTLLKGESAYLGIALVMQTTAGNEYQGLDLGGAFDISIIATQLAYEEDSFGPDYDEASTWNGYIPANMPETLEVVPAGGAQTGTITVNTPEDLVYLNNLANNWIKMYSNGQGTSVSNYRESNGGKGTDYYYHWTWTVKLGADLDMNNIPMNSIRTSWWREFDGNGHTISNVVLKDGQNGLFVHSSAAIRNLTVKNVVVNAPETNSVGAVAGSCGELNNVHVENATVTGGKYVGAIAGKNSSIVNCSVKNATVTANDKTSGGLVGYSIGDPGAATVTGNTVTDVTITGTYNVGGLLGQAQNETVENNTLTNVTVRSMVELPANASSNEVRTAEIAARSAFANTTIGANTATNVTVVEVAAANTTDYNAALTAGGEVSLAAGNYSMPGVSNKDLTIYGDKNTVITVNKPAFHGSDLTINGATVVGSGYSTGVQHVNTVTYNDATIKGEMCLYGEKVVFNNCTFELAKSQYLWTYSAKEVEFNNCTFNTAGKAILVYNEGAGASKVTVKGCTFNATAGDKAGAIKNQNCAAIEIDNFQKSGIGAAHVVVTENNTYNSNFSGEWRIKNYVAGNVITVNGVEYNQIALDGKLMTIDANSNVTVA